MKAARVVVYQDVQGEYRWRVLAANGEQVGDSGEGYVHHSRAVEMAAGLFPDAELVDESEGVSGEAEGA